MKINEKQLTRLISKKIVQVLNEQNDMVGQEYVSNDFFNRPQDSSFMTNIRKLNRLALGFINKHRDELGSFSDQYKLNNYFERTMPEREELVSQMLPLLQQCQEIYSQLPDGGKSNPAVYNFMQKNYQRCLYMVQNITKTPKYDQMLAKYFTDCINSEYTL